MPNTPPRDGTQKRRTTAARGQFVDAHVDMKLSEYEEGVLAELEQQFPADYVAVPCCRRSLAAAAVCFLTGIGGLLAANHAALAISLSNSYGFSTASITSGFVAMSVLVLLASAFLLGRAWDDLRQGARRRLSGAGRRA